MKIARELALTARATGRKLYVLDEPTTGLHLEDIQKLVVVFERLLDQGHTLLLIEHNLDVIKLADWVIDMGPEGGDGGGRVVGMGRPEEIATNPRFAHGEMAQNRFAGCGSASKGGIQGGRARRRNRKSRAVSYPAPRIFTPGR